MCVLVCTHGCMCMWCVCPEQPSLMKLQLSPVCTRNSDFAYFFLLEDPAMVADANADQDQELDLELSLSMGLGPRALKKSNLEKKLQQPHN